MRNYFLLVALLACHALNLATAAPKCPPNPIKVDLLELGIYFKSVRGVAAGQGIDRDLIDELGKRSGCTFDAQVQSRARTLIELKEGHTDMATALLSTPDREEFLWLFPYVRSHHIVLLGPAASSSIQTLADFQNARSLKFGVIRGFKHSAFYDPLINTWTKEGRVKIYVDEAHLINALIEGDVAAVTSYPGVFQFYLDTKMNPATVRVVDWDKSNLQVHGNLGLSKVRFTQAEAQEWSMLIKTLLQDGTLQKIYRKYVNVQEAKDMLP